MFGYRIQITNEGAETVQLVSRQWMITDGHGRTIEVRGAGVVGKQPVLRPGESFEYTSGTPLPTPNGIMVGSYQMVTTTGEHFDVAIPAFSLTSAWATEGRGSDGRRGARLWAQATVAF